ncbi:MAG: glycosyltransferase, partial [Candidatus Micrarchaeaceae archaeon]
MAKIAFVSDVAYPWIKGGMESLHYAEMRELSRKHEVYCFSLQFEGMEKEFVKDRIHYVTVAKVHSKELYTPNGSRSIKLARLFAGMIGKTLGKYDFDAIYVNSFPYLHLKTVKAYCKKHRCRLIMDVAEVWPKERWRAYLGSLKGSLAYSYSLASLKGADAYVANSSATAIALERIGIPRSSITVFSPVLDMKLINSVPRRSRTHRVIYAGRLIKEKRLDLWIDAVARAHSLDSSITGL